MKIKTSELDGAQLDWAVFEAEYGKPYEFTNAYKPSEDWAQGGPIIEREGFQVLHVQGGDNPVWKVESPRAIRQYGPTPLIAAMRCYVASKLGEEVEVPDAIA